MALSKGLLGTIQSIPLAQNPIKLHGEAFPPQNHFFTICVYPKGPWPSCNPNLRSGCPKVVLRVENAKLAYRKAMQNPVVGIPNGVICCNLWQKTVPCLPYPKGVWAASKRKRQSTVGRQSTVVAADFDTEFAADFDTEFKKMKAAMGLGGASTPCLRCVGQSATMRTKS